MPKPTIYIVDDDPSSAEILSEVATTAGYNVSVFHTARDFKRKIDEMAPDVIAMDLFMPETDGIELTQWLGTVGCQAKVFFVSGFNGIYMDMASELAHHYNIKVIGQLTKPININDFRETLASCA